MWIRKEVADLKERVEDLECLINDLVEHLGLEAEDRWTPKKYDFYKLVKRGSDDE